MEHESTGLPTERGSSPAEVQLTVGQMNGGGQQHGYSPSPLTERWQHQQAAGQSLGRSSVNVAALLRRRERASSGSSSQQGAGWQDYCTTGRIYHDEHFHGHRQYMSPTPGRQESTPVPTIVEDPFSQPSEQLREMDSAANGKHIAHAPTAPSVLLEPPPSIASGGYGVAPSVGGRGYGPRPSQAGGGYAQENQPEPHHHHAPMPKWPANFQSAAFGAVSQKRSYVLSPPEIYAEITQHGHEKSSWAWYKVVMLSMLAGCYVGFGYTTALQVGGLLEQAPSNPNEEERNRGLFNLIVGAMGFPFAFTIIVVAGAELFTSMCAYTAAAWWEGKIGVLDTMRMLFIVYFGNFAGAAVMVGLLYAAGTYEGKDGYLIYSAEHKVRGGWGSTFVKGILANWLVGLATWMANAAQDLTGKFVGIWLPISAFAAIGFEHCIANMFVIPMGIAMGADITARQFVWMNLIPCTFGNWIGGALFVATSYAFVYGRTPPRIQHFYRSKVNPHMPWGPPEGQEQQELKQQQWEQQWAGQEMGKVV